MFRLSRSDAARVRALIDAYDLHGGPLPVPVRWLAACEGWLIHYRSRITPLYGYAIVLGGVRLMVINEDVAEPTQRVTIAHELAHDLLGHTQVVDLFGPRFASYGLSDMIDRRQERDADIAAACLLIPPRAAEGCEHVGELASRCGVSIRAAALYLGLDYTEEHEGWHEAASGNGARAGHSLSICLGGQTASGGRSGTEDLRLGRPPSAG